MVLGWPNRKENFKKWYWVGPIILDAMSTKLCYNTSRYDGALKADLGPLMGFD
jgi:hypothetical protein